MTDNFDFDLYGAQGQPFVGYVSAVDKTVVTPRALVRGSKNVYKKDSGTLANRPGLKRRGSADSTSAGVKSSFEWQMSLGFTRPLRVANSKLQVESDIVTSGTLVWYDLLTSLTLTRFVFDTWWDNTAKKDVLLMVNGADDIYNWSGAMGLISSTTLNTIVLTSTVAALGFKSSGSVLVNGTTYTYSGVSGSTLTGVAPNPTGEANGSVVLQTVDTNSNKPAADFVNDFIKVVNNQLYCGSENSRLIYISDQTDYTNFSPGSPREPGDADILTLDDTPTGIGIRQGQAHVSSESAWYIVSFRQITVGSTLTEQTLVDKKPMSNLKGALAHEFIDTVGDDLVYLSADQQLTVFGTFRNINQPQFPSMSEAVKDDLANEDFVGGALRAVGDFIYITAPNNGTVWLHETRTSVSEQGNIVAERIWHSPFIWNLSRIAVIDGVEFGYSNANPQIYQMWNTSQWHDDSPSDDPLPYDSVAAFAYDQRGRRQGLIRFDKVYYEGYISQGTNLQSASVMDYQGSNGVLLGIINSIESPATFFSGDIGFSLGDASLGDNPLGDATSEEESEQELLPKFRVITKVNPVDVFSYQIRVFSSEPDSRWELICYGTNAQRSPNSPVFITK